MQTLFDGNAGKGSGFMGDVELHRVCFDLLCTFDDDRNLLFRALSGSVDRLEFEFRDVSDVRHNEKAFTGPERRSIACPLKLTLLESASHENHACLHKRLSLTGYSVPNDD